MSRAPHADQAYVRVGRRHALVHLLVPVENACCNHFGSVTAAREAANLEREISRWPERPVLTA